jgi:hypothetical protein
MTENQLAAHLVRIDRELSRHAKARSRRRSLTLGHWPGLLVAMSLLLGAGVFAALLALFSALA